MTSNHPHRWILERPCASSLLRGRPSSAALADSRPKMGCREVAYTVPCRQNDGPALLRLGLVLGLIVIFSICGESAIQTAQASFRQQDQFARQKNSQQKRMARGTTQNSTSINSSQLAVLKNDGVLEGRITQEPTQIIVEVEQGSRLVIARDRVEFICHSLDEAYWEKLARLKASDIAGQTRLFRWCLKHQLIQQAENQFEVLTQLDVSAVELDRLYRGLDSLRTRGQRKALAHPIRTEQSKLSPLVERPKTGSLTAAANEKQNRPSGWTAPNQPQVNPRLNDQIRSAHATSSQPRNSADMIVDTNLKPVEYLSTDSSHSGTSRPASLRDMEQQLKLLPEGSVSRFRKSVEPFLMLGCIQCHDQTRSTDGQPFALYRGTTKVNPLRFSQRNLYATLQYIDRSQPAERSRLWEIVTVPHGGEPKAVFPIESREARLIFRWLVPLTKSEQVDSGRFNALENESGRSSLSGAKFETTSDDAQAGSSHRGQATGPGPVATQPLRPLADPAVLSPDGRPELSSVGEIPQLDRNSNHLRGGFIPVDPFDPEIFHRRQAKAAKRRRQAPEAQHRSDGESEFGERTERFKDQKDQ